MTPYGFGFEQRSLIHVFYAYLLKWFSHVFYTFDEQKYADF